MIKKIIGLCVIAAIAYGAGYMYYQMHINESNIQVSEYLQQAQETYDAMPVWHKKIHTEQDIKIGIITDTHARASRVNIFDKSDNAQRYLKVKYTEPLQRFVADMNVFDPEFIVHLGDVIEGTGDDYYVGSQSITLVREELEKANKPVYWTVGNHDLRSVTKDQFKELVGVDTLDQSFDVGDYRFVILDGNYNRKDLPRSPEGNSFVPGNLPESTLTWLKTQLSTDKRVFVFIHQGTFPNDSYGDPVDAEDNTYDEEGNIIGDGVIDGVRYALKQSLDNAKELNEILKEYRVDGIFNGHMEARRYEKIDFTHHYSLTGTKKSEEYPQSFYELTITDSVPDVVMYYVPENTTDVYVVDFEACGGDVQCTGELQGVAQTL